MFANLPGTLLSSAADKVCFLILNKELITSAFCLSTSLIFVGKRSSGFLKHVQARRALETFRRAHFVNFGTSLGKF